MFRYRFLIDITTLVLLGVSYYHFTFKCNIEDPVLANGGLGNIYIGVGKLTITILTVIYTSYLIFNSIKNTNYTSKRLIILSGFFALLLIELFS